MAKELSKSGILTGADILAGHVTQSIDALTGIEAYDITISGSLEVTGSITGTPGITNNLTSSYSITSSHAEDTISSSYAITASHALNSGGGPAFPFTGSALITGSLGVTGSITGTPGTTNNLTSSYAITASHALNSGGGPAFPFTGSALITGSLGVTGSISNIQGNNKITLIDGVIDVSTPTNHLYIGTGGELTQSYSSGTDNVAIGLRAGFTSLTDPGAKNTFIGNTAGQYNTNTPQSNIGIGHAALANIQGDNNIGIGVSGVLGNGVSGGNNIGIGRASLYGIASGEHNISIGDGIAAFNGMDYQLKIGDGSIIAISASLTTGDIIFPSTASADYFVGDGSQLTNLPPTSTSTSSYTSVWSLGADGTDHYTFSGPGLTGAENDPDIYLTRGEVYKFNNNNSGGAHPFQIQTIGGSAYGDGVTNNGGAGGTSIEIDVQFDAPTKLFYQCTSHANMRGIIYIADAINHSGSFSGSFQGDGSQLTNLPGGGGSVGTLQQVTDSGSVTTNAITSSALYVLNGTNISPNGDGVGQLQIQGAGYTSYLTMDSSSAYLGHNSLVRDFSFQTNEITRLTLLQNGNISASGDIQALSFTGVAGTTNNLTSSYAITASHALNSGGGPAFPFIGDAQITGSLVVSGSFSPHGNGSTNGVVIGESAAHIGTGALNTGHVAIGDTAQANMYGVAIGYFATAGVDNISIGYKAGANHGTNSRGQIVIGTEVQPTTNADNSINFSANDQNISVFSPSEPKTFGVYLGSSTADSPDLKFIVGPESSSYWSGSGNFGFNTKTPNAPLAVEGSGSTIFNVQGSQGQLFSVTDDLLDEVFSVSDISGDPLLTVSGSGLVEIPVGPLHVTGSIEIASPSSSGHLSYTPPLSKAYSFTYNADNANFYNDGYISLGWDNGGGNDPELTILTDPSSDKVQAIVSDPESLTATTFDLLVANGVTDIYSTGMGQDQRLDVFISAGSDSTYPMYKLLWFRSNTTSGGNVSVIVERFNL